jgi:hypothetical protein
MSKLIAAICCLMLAGAPLALAQDKSTSDEKKSARGVEKSKKEPSEKQRAHQQRMKDCSKQAASQKLKGEERKKFMSGCLKG